MNKMLFIMVLFTSVLSFAEEDRFDTSGSVRMYGRHDRTKEDPFNQLRYQARVNATFSIDEEGCVQLAGRLTTGENFNSENELTGVGEGHNSLHVNLRHLYVNMSCLHEKVKLEVGAMPVRTYGSKGLSDNGWVDGARMIIENKERGQTWYVSAGEIDELDTPGVFDRELDGVNYIQAEVVQEFNKEWTGAISLSDYEDEVYARAAVRWALNKYYDWLESAKVEALFNDGERVGDHLMIAFKTDDWNFQSIRTYIEEEAALQDGRLIKNFYGLGTNYYLEGQRQINKRWRFYFRARQGDAKALVEAGFRADW
jgi:hypothetical protein